MFGLLFFAAAVAESIVETINNTPGVTWVAVEYPPSVMSEAKFRTSLGLLELNDGPSDYVPDNSLPESFDARTNWPGKILPVRDQAKCGSCWAFAAAETTGDRLEILGCGKGHMAPQDLVSCDKLDQGCNGGIPLVSWEHIKHTGITTEECMPYVSGTGRVPACPKTCNNGSEIVRKKASSVGHVSGKNMQQELYDHGPFEVGMTVYEDFKTYRSGVYKHVTGSKLGGHAILVVGWGVEDGTPYWIVQNSWNTTWGENGFFKILRGKNECGIESSAYAGQFKC